MATPIKAKHLEFRTKKEAQLYFREILNRYELGCILGSTDLKDVIALIDRHPERDMKIGSGISYVKIVQNPEYQNKRCFWLFRNDGTDTDFSYLTCINGKAKTIEQEFVEACRVSIMDQIIEYKTDFFSRDGDKKCEETGVPVRWDTCHVDHITPFATIVREFIHLLQISPAKEMLTESSDRQCSVRFACQHTESEWKTYHQMFAQLRVVSPEFNLSRKRK